MQKHMEFDDQTSPGGQQPGMETVYLAIARALRDKALVKFNNTRAD